MRTVGAVAALLIGALAACAPEDTWSSRVEEPNVIRDNPEIRDPQMILQHWLAAPPPEQLLRKPADFRIYDPHLRKEFFLYMYEDAGFSEEVITVINYALPQKARGQRAATPDEAEYAMELFVADWKSHGQAERLQYFNRRNAEEQYRKQTQLDDQIVHKTEEKKWWDTQVLNLEADLQSRQNTSTFAAGDEKLNLSETQKTQVLLVHAKRMQALAEVKLWVLEYKRAIRDSQYARGSAIFVDRGIPVADLLPIYSAPDKLAEEIRLRVHPFSWAQPDVRVYVAEGQLVVRHTREMVQRVQDYIGQMRAALQAKQQEKELVPAKK